MKLLAFAFTASAALALCGCSGHSGENQFDTNAAEMNEFPGDEGRIASETNGQAAQRAGKNGFEPKPQVAMTKGESSFAAAAAEAGLAEVALGRLAATKTTNQKLTDFAEMMVKDHAGANEELKTIANQKGIVLPTECSNCDGALKELHDMVGPEFERRYANMMVDDHSRAVALFEKESQSGTDPEIREWAKSKLPTLRHHLEMAKSLQADVVGQRSVAGSGKQPVKQDPAAPNTADQQADTTYQETTTASTVEKESTKTKKEIRKEKREARKAAKKNN